MGGQHSTDLHSTGAHTTGLQIADQRTDLLLSIPSPGAVRPSPARIGDLLLAMVRHRMSPPIQSGEITTVSPHTNRLVPLDPNYPLNSMGH